MHAIKSNQAGFSIVAVTIAAGMIGVIALGAASLIKDMITGQNTARIKGEMEAFHDELRSHLSNQDACFESLSALGPYTDGRTMTVPRIMNPPPKPPLPPAPATVRYVPNTTYDNANYQIESMNLEYKDTPTVPGTGEGTLIMRYRSQIPLLGPQTISRRMLIAINKNTATNAMTSCVSKGRMTDGLWQLHSNQQDIFYPGGRVGVGAASANPVWDLDVGGENRQVSAMVRAYSNGPVHDSAVFYGARGRGTFNSPQHVLAGDRLASFAGGSVLTTNTHAHMDVVASENHTNTAQGLRIDFLTAENGTIGVQKVKFRIDHDGAVYVDPAKINPKATLRVAGGIRAKLGLPNIGINNSSNVGYTFDDDGDTGVFAYGGTNLTNNWVAIVEGSIEVARFHHLDGMTVSTPSKFLFPVSAQSLTVTGDSTMTGRLTVNNAVTVNGPTAVNGSTAINGSLAVSGCVSSPTGMTVGGSCSSDRRFKENFVAMPPVADKLAQLHPTYYTWKPEYLPQGMAPDQQLLGLIAQDVAAALPNLVEIDSKGYYKVRYSDLVMYLLRGFSEHHERLAQMTALEAKQAALQDENKKLKESVAALNERLQKIEKILKQTNR